MVIVVSATMLLLIAVLQQPIHAWLSMLVIVVASPTPPSLRRNSNPSMHPNILVAPQTNLDEIERTDDDRRSQITRMKE